MNRLNGLSSLTCLLALTLLVVVVSYGQRVYACGQGCVSATCVTGSTQGYAYEAPCLGYFNTDYPNGQVGNGNVGNVYALATASNIICTYNNPLFGIAGCSKIGTFDNDEDCFSNCGAA